MILTVEILIDSFVDGRSALSKAIPDTKKYLTGPPTLTPLQIVTSKVWLASFWFSLRSFIYMISASGWIRL